MVALSVPAAGCGSSRSGQFPDSRHARQQVQKQARGAEREHVRYQHEKHVRELQTPAGAHVNQRAERRSQVEASGCPSHTLRGVYHPDRLVVRDPCRRVTGTVDDVRDEEDGDIHVLVAVDKQYRAMLMANNRSEQGGDLVVEFMPRDYGHLPRPVAGDRIALVGAYVDDTEHNWAELHPVWAVSLNGGPVHSSGPQFGGSPPYAMSTNALATCHTNNGARCHGYDGEVAPPPDDESRSDGAGRREPRASDGGSCTPGYSPCLPPASDYDCAGGGGDGPEYTGRVRVTGSDPYDLDSDGDGLGCE